MNAPKCHFCGKGYFIRLYRMNPRPKRSWRGCGWVCEVCGGIVYESPEIYVEIGNTKTDHPWITVKKAEDIG